MNAYLISGLGADRRAFVHLELPPGFNKIFLDWIPPLPHETLPAYARRLSEGIDATRPFVLIGLSMGGMMAVEISKLLRPEKLILISSVPSFRFLPRYFRMAYHLKLHEVTPVGLMKFGSYLKWYFARETEDKKLLHRIIMESDPAFIRWGLEAVLKWNGELKQKDYVHIHGSSDWLLPVGKMKPTHLVKGGGHMMIVDRCGEINAVLKKVLL